MMQKMVLVRIPLTEEGPGGDTKDIIEEPEEDITEGPQE